MAAPYSPIKEEEDDGHDFSGGCCCFRGFCFGRDEGSSRHHLLQERLGDSQKEAWVVAQIKKLKQLSELVAGPKWKNFIRKIGRLCRCKNQVAPPYQYSPDSYALNFAGDQVEEEGGTLSHSFSARFATRV